MARERGQTRDPRAVALERHRLRQLEAERSAEPLAPTPPPSGGGGGGGQRSSVRSTALPRSASEGGGAPQRSQAAAAACGGAGEEVYTRYFVPRHRPPKNPQGTESKLTVLLKPSGGDGKLRKGVQLRCNRDGEVTADPATARKSLASIHGKHPHTARINVCGTHAAIDAALVLDTNALGTALTVEFHDIEHKVQLSLRLQVELGTEAVRQHEQNLADVGRREAEREALLEVWRRNEEVREAAHVQLAQADAVRRRRAEDAEAETLRARAREEERERQLAWLQERDAAREAEREREREAERVQDRLRAQEREQIRHREQERAQEVAREKARERERQEEVAEREMEAAQLAMERQLREEERQLEKERELQRRVEQEMEKERDAQWQREVRRLLRMQGVCLVCEKRLLEDELRRTLAEQAVEHTAEKERHARELAARTEREAAVREAAAATRFHTTGPEKETYHHVRATGASVVFADAELIPPNAGVEHASVRAEIVRGYCAGDTLDVASHKAAVSHIASVGMRRGPLQGGRVLVENRCKTEVGVLKLGLPAYEVGHSPAVCGVFLEDIVASVQAFVQAVCFSTTSTMVSTRTIAVTLDLDVYLQCDGGGSACVTKKLFANVTVCPQILTLASDISLGLQKANPPICQSMSLELPRCEKQGQINAKKFSGEVHLEITCVDGWVAGACTLGFGLPTDVATSEESRKRKVGGGGGGAGGGAGKPHTTCSNGGVYLSGTKVGRLAEGSAGLGARARAGQLRMTLHPGATVEVVKEVASRVWVATEPDDFTPKVMVLTLRGTGGFEQPTTSPTAPAEPPLDERACFSWSTAASVNINVIEAEPKCRLNILSPTVSYRRNHSIPDALRGTSATWPSSGAASPDAQPHQPAPSTPPSPGPWTGGQDASGSRGVGAAAGGAAAGAAAVGGAGDDAVGATPAAAAGAAGRPPRLAAELLQVASCPQRSPSGGAYAAPACEAAWMPLLQDAFFTSLRQLHGGSGGGALAQTFDASAEDGVPSSPSSAASKQQGTQNPRDVYFMGGSLEVIIIGGSKKGDELCLLLDGDPQAGSTDRLAMSQSNIVSPHGPTSVGFGGSGSSQPMSDNMLAYDKEDGSIFHNGVRAACVEQQGLLGAKCVRICFAKDACLPLRFATSLLQSVGFRSAHREACPSVAGMRTVGVYCSIGSRSVEGTVSLLVAPAAICASDAPLAQEQHFSVPLTGLQLADETSNYSNAKIAAELVSGYGAQDRLDLLRDAAGGGGVAGGGGAGVAGSGQLSDPLSGDAFADASAGAAASPPPAGGAEMEEGLAFRTASKEELALDDDVSLADWDDDKWTDTRVIVHAGRDEMVGLLYTRPGALLVRLRKEPAVAVSAQQSADGGAATGSDQKSRHDSVASNVSARSALSLRSAEAGGGGSGVVGASGTTQRRRLGGGGGAKDGAQQSAAQWSAQPTFVDELKMLLASLVFRGKGAQGTSGPDGLPPVVVSVSVADALGGETTVTKRVLPHLQPRPFVHLRPVFNLHQKCCQYTPGRWAARASAGVVAGGGSAASVGGEFFQMTSLGTGSVFYEQGLGANAGSWRMSVDIISGKDPHDTLRLAPEACCPPPTPAFSVDPLSHYLSCGGDAFAALKTKGHGHLKVDFLPGATRQHVEVVFRSLAFQNKASHMLDGPRKVNVVLRLDESTQISQQVTVNVLNPIIIHQPESAIVYTTGSGCCTFLSPVKLGVPAGQRLKQGACVRVSFSSEPSVCDELGLLPDPVTTYVDRRCRLFNPAGVAVGTVRERPHEIEVHFTCAATAQDLRDVLSRVHYSHWSKHPSSQPRRLRADVTNGEGMQTFGTAITLQDRDDGISLILGRERVEYVLRSEPLSVFSETKVYVFGGGNQRLPQQWLLNMCFSPNTQTTQFDTLSLSLPPHKSSDPKVHRLRLCGRGFLWWLDVLGDTKVGALEKEKKNSKGITVKLESPNPQQMEAVLAAATYHCTRPNLKDRGETRVLQVTLRYAAAANAPGGSGGGGLSAKVVQQASEAQLGAGGGLQRQVSVRVPHEGGGGAGGGGGGALGAAKYVAVPGPVKASLAVKLVAPLLDDSLCYPRKYDGTPVSLVPWVCVPRDCLQTGSFEARFVDCDGTLTTLPEDQVTLVLPQAGSCAAGDEVDTSLVLDEDAGHVLSGDGAVVAVVTGLASHTLSIVFRSINMAQATAVIRGVKYCNAACGSPVLSGAGYVSVAVKVSLVDQFGNACSGTVKVDS